MSATIAHTLGAGLMSLTLDGPDGTPTNLLRPGIGRDFTDLAMYLMAPWTNRIAGAAFEYRGRGHKLRPDWADGTAIHGDVKTRTWSILDRSPVSASLELHSRELVDANWGWAYTAGVRYELRREVGTGPEIGALDTVLSIRNLGDTPMPVGLGFHPFFQRKLWGADEVRLRAATTGRYPLKKGVPTGGAGADEVTTRLASDVALGDLALDDVFAGFMGRARITWPASRIEAEFDCTPNLGHLVVYSPQGGGGEPEPWFCVEPVTMVSDGFNALARGEGGTGVMELPPGQMVAALMRITVREVPG